MNITDELREYTEKQIKWLDVSKVHYRKMFAIADRIDAEHERQLGVLYRDMSDAEWVRLPKDADGEYIHVGDVMEWCDSGDTLEVIGIGDDTLFYIDPEGDRTYAEWTSARNKRHHAPTVEDVLTEMVAKVIERGELTNGAAQTIAEYAKRLTLAEGEDA